MEKYSGIRLTALIVMLGLAVIISAAVLLEKQDRPDPLKLAYSELSGGIPKEEALAIVEKRYPGQHPLVLKGENREVWRWEWQDKDPPQKEWPRAAQLTINFVNGQVDGYSYASFPVRKQK